MHTLEEIKKITTEDLQTLDGFRLFKTSVDEFIQFKHFGDAKELCIFIMPLFKKVFPSLKEAQRSLYEDIITKLELYTILSLSEEELREFLHSRVARAARLHLPLVEQFGEYIDYFHDYYFDFEQAQFFVSSLRSNNEQIGTKTILEWLNGYQMVSGTQVPRGGLQRMTFLNQDATALRLSVEDRKILLIILEFFDWLSYPTPDYAHGEETEEDALIANKTSEEIRMKMADFRAMKGGVKTEENGAENAVPEPVLPASPPAAHPVIKAPAEAPRVESKPAEAASPSAYILKNNLTPVQCIAYLKEQFPQPTDFKKVLKILNELNRQGNTHYMEIVYFDQTDGKFHWNE